MLDLYNISVKVYPEITADLSVKVGKNEASVHCRPEIHSDRKGLVWLNCCNMYTHILRLSNQYWALC